MSPLEYDRERVAAAERLGVRVGTLDREVQRLRSEDAGEPDSTGGQAFALEDPEPWPRPVDGAALADEIVETIRRHTVTPGGTLEGIAGRILHAHGHEAAFISPVLAITSPVLGCGKTTMLGVIGALVPRPLAAANITPAALFRSVEKWQPSLLIDEADTFLQGSDDLRGVLNSGHCRTSAYVIRTVGDDHEPRRFATWAPKAIALIGSLPATLASRSIEVQMRRLGAGERVEPFRPDRDPAALEPLVRKAWRWARDNEHKVRHADPGMPAILRGRIADNWRPLIAIADALGGRWPEAMRMSAEALTAAKTDDAEAAAILLLGDIRAILANQGEASIASSDLCAALTAMESRPWPEWKAGKPISPRQVARLLAPFGVEPTTIRDGARVAKGYRLDAFADAFSRYLPSQSVTPLQSLVDSGLSDFRSVTSPDGVTDRKLTKPLGDSGCNGVTDRNPQTWRDRV